MRGAHPNDFCNCASALGPSPRAWGSRPRLVNRQTGERSIPTCVGLTDPADRTLGRAAVHPHVRGAHGNPAAQGDHPSGPSPRAWGSHNPDQGHWVLLRSIPTCVGLTDHHHAGRHGSAVHPHVRGAHGFSGLVRPSTTGPSPRAWGSHITGLLPGFPALVHPHVRGAHGFRDGLARRSCGPSPRAWGSQKLTCNFARRYLLVIWIVGSFAIHDTLDRFPEHRPLNGDMRGRRGIRTTPHGPAVPPSARTVTLPGGRAGPTRRGPARVPPTACEGRPYSTRSG